MAQRREKKAPPGKERRPIKKKTSILITESIDYIDYKDVNLLRRFMSERAKVRARRVTGNTQQQQVAVAKAIRVAREMALLPYSVRQVTQRSKGRRDRGDRGERGDRGDREGELRDIPGPIRDDDRPAPIDESDINEGALDQATIDQVESEFNDAPTNDDAAGAGAAAESDPA
jgi:small subunit ribosomal protein S18